MLFAKMTYKIHVVFIGDTTNTTADFAIRRENCRHTCRGGWGESSYRVKHIIYKNRIESSKIEDGYFQYYIKR